MEKESKFLISKNTRDKLNYFISFAEAKGGLGFRMHEMLDNLESSFAEDQKSCWHEVPYREPLMDPKYLIGKGVEIEEFCPQYGTPTGQVEIKDYLDFKTKLKRRDITSCVLQDFDLTFKILWRKFKKGSKLVFKNTGDGYKLLNVQDNSGKNQDGQQGVLEFMYDLEFSK